MKTINLGEQNSIFNHFIREIRDISIQNDSMRFRRNIERIGEIFAYEISKKMKFKNREITTPLGISTESLIDNKPVLATILRAGLPLHQGFLNYFDSSDNCFISNSSSLVPSAVNFCNFNSKIATTCSSLKLYLLLTFSLSKYH